MKKDLILVIMAAGIGSRFGGLKQIEPIGPNGEFLIDYSIYDAIEAGFTKVVFVIKKENEEVFKETIGNRVSKYIEVAYAFQDIQDVPEGFVVPKERQKPWGTAHAVYAARNFVNGAFAVINADDFYGGDAYKTVADFLMQKENNYCIVGYLVKNTLSENGSVKRGVCKETCGKLISLMESSIQKETEGIKATPLNGETPFYVGENDLVCMNMLGFRKNLFDYIKSDFSNFLEKSKNNIETAEYFIPDVICGAQEKGYAEVEVIKTTSIWQGVTYKEDKDLVVSYIKGQIEKGIYPSHLWN
ncbi:MAG: sugar phosphate nucleotidyltransferase [Bacilli bacterium]|nr:sugar phosphate nucleotidyltransferase [Bacilli bacterium]